MPNVERPPGSPRQSETRKGQRSYQNFEGEPSDSDTLGKLAALKLSLLRREGAVQDLEGLSVLDLGCNEGFFCAEAVRRGAKRVVGLDRDGAILKVARLRCPEATFVRASWWDLPAEKFDVILFLSAIHYESDQRRLLCKLAEHLTANGTLVLECGVASDATNGSHGWRLAPRCDGLRRFPTMPYLLHTLLDAYACRHVGASVDQKGDPVPRQVFHCKPRLPIALLVVGASMLGDALQGRSIVSYQIDRLLTGLARDQSYRHSLVSRSLHERFAGEENFDVVSAGNHLVEKKLEQDLVELIVAEAPIEADLFAIEGQILAHESLLAALQHGLGEKRVKTWIVKPGQLL